MGAFYWSMPYRPMNLPDALDGFGLLSVAASRNPPWVHNLNDRRDASTMTFLVKAVAVTPTSVTFTPPLPMDLSALAPALVVYRHRLIEGVGLDDFSLD